MAISQELENAIRGSIHSAAGAIELIDRCNANLATDTYAAASITNLVVATGLTVGSTAVMKSVNATTVSAASGYVPALSATNAVLASNITALTGVFKSLDCSNGMSALTGTFKAIDCSTSMTCPTGNFPALKGTNMTLASNVTALTGVFKSLDCSTGITALGATAGTNGINCAVGPLVLASKYISGGTGSVASQAVLLSSPICLLSLGTSDSKYFKLPAPAGGLMACNVINLGSAACLIGNAGESLANATVASLASMSATGSAIDLVCDGTNWWKRAV